MEPTTEDACYHLAVTMAGDVPTADELAAAIAAFPEHEDALLDFAVWSAIDAIGRPTDDADIEPMSEEGSPLVQRAMQRLRAAMGWE